MSSKLSLPQMVKMMIALPPLAAGDAAARTSTYVSCKNSAKVYLLYTLQQGSATPPVIQILQATNIAGAGSKVLANPSRIWASLNDTVVDQLVLQAAGVNFTLDASIAAKVVVLELDMADLDVTNGYDCIAFNVAASAAGNLDSAMWIMDGERYQGSAMPSARIN